MAPRLPWPAAGPAGSQMTGCFGKKCPASSEMACCMSPLPYCAVLLLLLLSIGAGALGTALLGVMSTILICCLLLSWVCSGGVHAFEAVCGPGTAAL